VDLQTPDKDPYAPRNKALSNDSLTIERYSQIDGQSTLQDSLRTQQTMANTMSVDECAHCHAFHQQDYQTKKS
jgi:hypothetical protein